MGMRLPGFDAENFVHTSHTREERVFMKKAVGFLGILAMVLLFGGSALAEVKYFRGFSIDVPDGWVSSQEQGSAVIYDKDQSCLVTITVDQANGKKGEEMAKMFQEQFKGGPLSPEKEMGDAFSFTFKDDDGDENRALVAVGDDDKCVFMTILGDHPQLAGMLATMKDN